MLEMSKTCLKSKSTCRLKSCRSSGMIDTQHKTTSFLQDFFGQFPDEPVLSAVDKILYGIGVGKNVVSSNDGLPPCCTPKSSSSHCQNSCDPGAVTAFKSTKGSTTSIISLKSSNSGQSTASRMRYKTPCGKSEEHFIFANKFTDSEMKKACHTGPLDRVISWAKALPCPKAKKSESRTSQNSKQCSKTKPKCCKRINCRATGCADAKINMYDDGSKTVEIVEKRPPNCRKTPETLLFIGILPDGTAVSFDLLENC